MKFKYSVGHRFGKNNNLEVVGIKVGEKNSKSLYSVKCHECCKDPELNGDAIYEVPSEYVINGKLPCGCSKSEKKSKQQWEVLLNRKAKENNHVFNGFVGDLKGQNTKIDITCNNCGANYKTCPMDNYLRDRGCPSCARISKTLPEDVWIQKFIEFGKFHKEHYSFKRLSRTGKLWSVHCNVCNVESVSNSSSLVVGKVPCACGSGGGFDVNKTGYFYILSVSLGNESIVKYGITNFYRRRLTDHKRTLKTINATIDSYLVFEGDGKRVLELESHLKRTIPRVNKGVDGFRSECCLPEYFSEIHRQVQSCNFKEVL